MGDVEVMLIAQAMIAAADRRRAVLRKEICRRARLPPTFYIWWDDRADELVVTESLSARTFRVSLPAFSDWIAALARHIGLDRPECDSHGLAIAPEDPGPPPWRDAVVAALAPMRIDALDADMGVVADPGAGHGTWLRVLVPDEHVDAVVVLVRSEFVRAFGGCDLRSRSFEADNRVLLIFEAWPYASPTAAEMDEVARRIALSPVPR